MAPVRAVSGRAVGTIPGHRTPTLCVCLGVVRKIMTVKQMAGTGHTTLTKYAKGHKNFKTKFIKFRTS